MEPKTFTCPKCGAKEPLDARYCNNCGAILLSGAESAKSEGGEEPKTESEEKPKWYKNKKIIIPVIVGAILFAGGGTALYYSAKSRDTKKIAAFELGVKDSWGEVLTKSKELKDILADVSEAKDLEEVARLVPDIKDAIDKEIFDAKSLDEPGKYNGVKAKLNTALEKYKSYLDKLLEISRTPEDAKVPEDFTNLESKSQEATSAISEFQAAAAFAGDVIPKEVFDTAKIKKIIEAFQKDTKAKADAEKQAAQEAAKAADQKAAEDAVNKFMAAYKARNEAQARTYLTSAASGEHPSTEFSHADYEVASFRISDTALAGSKYKILVREYEQYIGDPSLIQVKKTFTVVKQGSNFLIDAWDFTF